MNKFDARTFLQLKKRSKLFFSLAVVAGAMQQVNASTSTSLGVLGESGVKELVAIQGQVSGKVIDSSSGNPVSGVTISVKGTAVGTQTSENGSFSISAKTSDVLVISSIGYQPTEVKVTGTSALTIRLVSAQDQLDEVIVVGYGTQKKSEVTSAVASVKEKDFNQGGMRSPMELIQGKVSGLNITRTQGSNPNSGTSIQLRGMASLKGTNSPLIVIDGIPGGSLDLVKQGDIESIDVLKDGFCCSYLWYTW
ncbi:carboxypeptidase-like regulatory domain-containing protein [Sphingobacterium sp. SG20118]|uniref:carboxypeptidase-like regulatory domain-containing protein n=1 Tax=Sphingobacterium sp. SG20118 TaxID=3367156 RepID=UPI0037DFC06D